MICHCVETLETIFDCKKTQKMYTDEVRKTITVLPYGLEMQVRKDHMMKTLHKENNMIFTLCVRVLFISYIKFPVKNDGKI